MQVNRWNARRWVGSWLMGALLMALPMASALARHPDLDLDALSDAQIDHLLLEEMDDASLRRCGLGNFNAAVPVDQMFKIIMCALSDYGDEGDETDLDLDDLEAEMKEAGTTVAEVVMQAMVEADRLARLNGAPGGGSVGVAMGSGGGGVGRTDGNAAVGWATVGRASDGSALNGSAFQAGEVEGSALRVAMRPDGDAGASPVETQPMLLAFPNGLINPAKAAVGVTKDYVREGIRAAPTPKR